MASKLSPQQADEFFDQSDMEIREKRKSFTLRPPAHLSGIGGTENHPAQNRLAEVVFFDSFPKSINFMTKIFLKKAICSCQ